MHRWVIGPVEHFAALFVLHHKARIDQRGQVMGQRRGGKAQMRADGAPYEEAATIAMAVAKGERTLTEAEPPGRSPTEPESSTSASSKRLMDSL